MYQVSTPYRQASTISIIMDRPRLKSSPSTGDWRMVFHWMPTPDTSYRAKYLEPRPNAVVDIRDWRGEERKRGTHQVNQDFFWNPAVLLCYSRASDPAVLLCYSKTSDSAILLFHSRISDPAALLCYSRTSDPPVQLPSTRMMMMIQWCNYVDQSFPNMSIVSCYGGLDQYVIMLDNSAFYQHEKAYKHAQVPRLSLILTNIYTNNDAHKWLQVHTGLPVYYYFSSLLLAF